MKVKADRRIGFENQIYQPDILLNLSWVNGLMSAYKTERTRQSIVVSL